MSKALEGSRVTVLTARPDLVLATSLWSPSLCSSEERGRALLQARVQALDT